MSYLYVLGYKYEYARCFFPRGPCFYRHVGRISFVVALICVVQVDACSPQMNLRGPARPGPVRGNAPGLFRKIRRKETFKKKKTKKKRASLWVFRCSVFVCFRRADGTKRRQGGEQKKKFVIACLFQYFRSDTKAPFFSRPVPELPCPPPSLQCSPL